ncbi:hypothetical protein NLJ89_g10119 [Agrocybe chaxingu]|uniref:Uncharacterized protein n=1 Tax=Agrocybe chaxingu TaxID=84603 RepID=A0A9W8MSF4_9AGAR|nr:hypothetical protein NLJ89_g10119 [Agrocybe chaxingu]
MPAIVPVSRDWRSFAAAAQPQKTSALRSTEAKPAMTGGLGAFTSNALSAFGSTARTESKPISGGFGSFASATPTLTTKASVFGSPFGASSTPSSSCATEPTPTRPQRLLLRDLHPSLSPPRYTLMFQRIAHLNLNSNCTVRRSKSTTMDEDQ